MPSISHSMSPAVAGRSKGENQKCPARREKSDGQCRLRTGAIPETVCPSGSKTAVRQEKSGGEHSFLSSGRLWDVLCLLLWGAGVFLCEEVPFALTLLCAAVLHECGHIAAFLLLGEPMPALRAGRLGLQLCATRPMPPRRECLVAFAGPAVNLLCALVLWALCGAGLPFYMHLMTAAGNLAPVGSLDGGRILRTLCEVRFSPRTARSLWRGVSLVTLCAGLWASLCALWCRGTGGYLFFLCFSLFLSHIAGKDRE